MAEISGGTLGPPRVLQAGADRSFAILPDWDGLMFSLPGPDVSVAGQYWVALP